MYGAGESVEFLAVELTDAPEHVAEALQVAPGAQVVRRARRLMNADGDRSSCLRRGSPVVSPRLRRGCCRLSGLSVAPLGTWPRLRVIMLRTAATRSPPGSPPQRESELLQLQEPAAVLVYRFTVYADDDAPIRTDEATYPPDQWPFRQEYPLAL